MSKRQTKEEPMTGKRRVSCKDKGSDWDSFDFSGDFGSESSGLPGLHRQRMRKGLTQAMLARLVGCSDNLLSNYENCRIDPSLKMLKRLAVVLGVTEQELIDEPRQK